MEQPFIDDLNHEPSPSPRWRESYYFETFDSASGWGTYQSIGERPAKNHAGALVVVWSPERALVTMELDVVRRDERHHRAGGLMYECLEPGRQWRLSYSGLLREAPGESIRVSPQLTAPNGKGPATQVSFELLYEGIGDPYLHRGGGAWAPMFEGHIDQAGRYTGWLKVGTEEVSLDGAMGYRDRSWGSRDWFYPLRWRYGWFPLGGDDDVVCFWRCETDEETLLGGFVRRGGHTRSLRGYNEEVTYDDADGVSLPRQISFQIEDADGWSTTIRGTVLRAVPAVFSNRTSGQQAWVDRCLVQFRDADGRTCFGQYEHEERFAAATGTGENDG